MPVSDLLKPLRSTFPAYQTLTKPSAAPKRLPKSAPQPVFSLRGHFRMLSDVKAFLNKSTGLLGLFQGF